MGGVHFLAVTAGDAANYALAAFLVAVGAGLAYAFLRLGGTFGRLSSFIRGTEEELLPVIHKVGESVDKVRPTDSVTKAGNGSTRPVSGVGTTTPYASS